jgi:diguanylate cyclase (GGDEF)-like protein
VPLIIVEDSTRRWVQEVPDDQDRIVVGRALTSTIVIEDTSASREHCAVERDGGDERWLVDLGSRNGTRVNGRYVTKALLKPGDRIEIGTTVITFAGSGAEGAQRAEQLRQRESLQAPETAEALAVDPLTGLASFPALVLELRRWLTPTSDEGPQDQVAVIKLDVDYLGLLNDMFGMRAGDEVIRHTGQGIRDGLEDMPGSRGVVGRESGGKFLVLLPHSTAEQARELAELARLRVSEREMGGALSEATLTCSAGVAEAPTHGRTWDELLLRAEQALSRAKRDGRDRVRLARDPAKRDTEGVRRPFPGGRTSGLWAADGLWDPGVARGRRAGAPVPAALNVPRDVRETQEVGGIGDSDEALGPLTLTHQGQSMLGLVAQALGSDLDLDSLLGLSLRVLIENTQATQGTVLLRDPAGAMRLRAAMGAGGKPSTHSTSQRIVRQVLDSRSAVLVSDALADERFKTAESVVAQGVRSVIAAPIPWGDEVVGVIVLEHLSLVDRFAAAERDLVLAFARLVAGPIRRQTLHQAQSDELERARVALARTAESEGRRRRRYANIVGDSPAMKDLFRLMDRVVETHHPVLIYGESGTGKELVARAIHYNGPRSKGPFIAENCAAFSESLLEAELFGHAQGAFTGADRDRKGLIEAADGGTLFLDEIGDMSPAMQAKLLRVLQEGELRPVGGQDVVRVDLRLLSASNKRLLELAQTGQFREDLYYRLAVMTIDLPALRERHADVAPLLEHFLSEGAREEGREVPTIAPDALQLLVHYEWPGNVRELENEAKKLLALAGATIEVVHLSPKLLHGASPGRPHSAIRRVAVNDGTDALMLMVERGKGLAEVIEAFESEAIARILKLVDGNRSETARRLGLSRPGLLKKMKRYGIS